MKARLTCFFRQTGSFCLLCGVCVVYVCGDDLPRCELRCFFFSLFSFFSFFAQYI